MLVHFLATSMSNLLLFAASSSKILAIFPPCNLNRCTIPTISKLVLAVKFVSTRWLAAFYVIHFVIGIFSMNIFTISRWALTRTKLPRNFLTPYICFELYIFALRFWSELQTVLVVLSSFQPTIVKPLLWLTKISSSWAMFSKAPTTRTPPIITLVNSF